VQERWGWELPGGLVDVGEDPAGAATRELEDQAGFRAGRLEHLVTFQAAPDVGEAERTVFSAQGAELSSPRRVQS
jgi:8-oxo-dGTP pyrophosphatase MutT (NUDIX family)